MKSKSTGYNSGFALCGLTCLAETVEQGSKFVLRMNSTAKNPPQLKAAKNVIGNFTDHSPLTDRNEI